MLGDNGGHYGAQRLQSGRIPQQFRGNNEHCLITLLVSLKKTSFGPLFLTGVFFREGAEGGDQQEQSAGSEAQTEQAPQHDNVRDLPVPSEQSLLRPDQGLRHHVHESHSTIWPHQGRETDHPQHGQFFSNIKKLSRCKR